MANRVSAGPFSAITGHTFVERSPDFVGHGVQMVRHGQHPADHIDGVTVNRENQRGLGRIDASQRR